MHVLQKTCRIGTYKKADRLLHEQTTPALSGDGCSCCPLCFSFFDEQSGAFSIVIKDIRATTSHSEQGLDSAHGMQTAKPGHRDWHSDEEEEDLQKQTAESVTATNKRHSTPGGSSWWRGVFCGLL
jgi:hypothetical protein